jgi:hypothetical protein
MNLNIGCFSYIISCVLKCEILKNNCRGFELQVLVVQGPIVQSMATFIR